MRGRWCPGTRFEIRTLRLQEAKWLLFYAQLTSGRTGLEPESPYSPVWDLVVPGCTRSFIEVHLKGLMLWVDALGHDFTR